MLSIINGEIDTTQSIVNQVVEIAIVAIFAIFRRLFGEKYRDESWLCETREMSIFRSAMLSWDQPREKTTDGLRLLTEKGRRELLTERVVILKVGKRSCFERVHVVAARRKKTLWRSPGRSWKKKKKICVTPGLRNAVRDSYVRREADLGNWDTLKSEVTVYWGSCAAKLQIRIRAKIRLCGIRGVAFDQRQNYSFEELSVVSALSK